MGGDKKDYKKKHRSRDHDNNTAGSGSGEDNAEPMWVEKEIDLPAVTLGASVAAGEKPTSETDKPSSPPRALERASWMTDGSQDFSLFGVTKEKEERPTKADPDKPFISTRELNPHLKSGIPFDQYPEVQKPTFKFGDAGSSWRMIKLKRTMEQAEEQGRSLEEVGIERYGSLDKLQEALAERTELDRRRSGRDRNRDRSDQGLTRGDDNRSRMMFTDSSSSSYRSGGGAFRRPEDWRRDEDRHRDEDQRRDDAERKADVDEFGRTKKRVRTDTKRDAEREGEKGREAVSSAKNPTSASIPLIITSHAVATPPATATDVAPVMTTDELNKLNARVVKAQLMGGADAEELEKRYEVERKRAEEAAKSGNGKLPMADQISVIPTIDSSGRLHEFALKPSSPSPAAASSRRKKEAFDSHDPRTGERVRYQRGDDTISLEDLVRQERYGARGIGDMDKELAGRIVGDAKFQDDLDYLDEHAEKMASKKDRTEEQKMKFAVEDYKRTQQILDSCPNCYRGVIAPKCPVVSLGTKSYLALPTVADMVPGHCWIVPIQHAVTSLECDDDVWEEIRNFMKCLMRMFAAEQRGVVFLENVINLRRRRHTIIEVIPMPRDLALDAPAYFKEGILGSESEWSQHKKLIDTVARGGFRRSMVKEMPYFHVWFGPDGGYGHVIEDEGEWDERFGKEIVAGMLDLDPGTWRRPRKQDSRNDQRRVQEFSRGWKKWDWTAALEGGEFAQE